MKQANAMKTAALVSVTAAATSILIQACGGSSDAVAQLADPPDPMIGVWDAVITVRDCTTGEAKASFNSMATMHSGGTMSAGGDTFGVWKREANGTYTVTLQFYLTNADGSFAGWQKVKATRTLAADGNTYTSTISRWQVDAAGAAGPQGCATESAKRASWS